MAKMAGRPADSWDRIRRQFARVEPPFDSSDTLPPARYTDPDIFERELETVFHASWIGIGRADRWMAPGIPTSRGAHDTTTTGSTPRLRKAFRCSNDSRPA